MISILMNFYAARAGNTALEPIADTCWRRTMNFAEDSEEQGPQSSISETCLAVEAGSCLAPSKRHSRVAMLLSGESWRSSVGILF